MRDALAPYTLHGNAGHLLDGESDNLAFSDFTCFELEALWPYADSEKLPVLSYLFHRIERQLTGSPAVIILDEAWVMLGHPIFRAKIVEWLKVLRKANCAVVMATQSLTDAINSGILDIIIESTATRIFLPNTAANSEVSAAHLPDDRTESGADRPDFKGCAKKAILRHVSGRQPAVRPGAGTGGAVICSAVGRPCQKGSAIHETQVRRAVDGLLVHKPGRERT